MFEAGCDAKPVVFLFADTQVVEESFLEDINNILNSGEVPNRMETEDMERILAAVRPLAKAAGKSESRDAIYAHFVQLVRENLHIVLCMSPIGDAFRVRCRMFPSLINCCTIDWFDEWPKDALLSVAERYFEGVDLGTPEIKKEICEACVRDALLGRPHSEAFFAELRQDVHDADELPRAAQPVPVDARRAADDRAAEDCALPGRREQARRHEQGGGQAEEGARADAAGARAGGKDTQQLLEEVATDQANADEVKQKVTKEEAQVGEIAKEAQAIAADAQRDLDEAMPAYHSAVEALNKLDKKDIQEVKSYAKPPALVMTVMEAVCLLMGQKTDWSDAKVLLNQSNFLQQLAEYDNDNILEKKIKSIQKYMKEWPTSTPPTSRRCRRRAARSACGCARWTRTRASRRPSSRRRRS